MLKCERGTLIAGWACHPAAVLLRSSLRTLPSEVVPPPISRTSVEPDVPPGMRTPVP